MKALSLPLFGIVICGMILCSANIRSANAEPVGRPDSRDHNRNLNPGDPEPPPPEPAEMDFLAEPEVAPTAPAPGSTGNELYGKFNKDPFEKSHSNANSKDEDSFPAPGSEAPGKTGSELFNSYDKNPFDTGSRQDVRKPYGRRPIVIHCPESNEGSCRYSLISASGRVYSYSISPGQKQEFWDTTNWVVRFNRGEGRGYKTYRLHGDKEYKFRGTGDGNWDFYVIAGS